jgi:glycosyltransferase involved in cell wall biosynthesis
MTRYENQACARFDGIITISEVDKALLSRITGHREIHAVPIGVDSENYSPVSASVHKNSLLFTGSLHWKPNEDGILYFARSILRKITASIPDLRVTVVGRHPTKRLLGGLRRHSNITCIPDVPDVRPYMSSHEVFIVPLRIGGGVRLKIYEAMAMGMPVVSTFVGVEGLPIEDQKHLVVASDPDSFAAAVIRLLRDAEMRRRIGCAAREFVMTKCGWDEPARTFAKICQRIAGV